MYSRYEFLLLAAWSLLNITFAAPSPHGQPNVARAYGSCKPNTWVNLTSIPTPRQEHSTVAINETAIAILGGVTPKAGFISTVDTMQVYDIPSDTWRSAAPLPYAVNHPNVIVANGLVYLLGGLVPGPLNPGQQINWVASGQCAVYDPMTNTWKSIASMPPGTERGSAVLGLHGEMVYLAGGMTVLMDGYQDSLTMVTALNVTSGQWQRLPAPAADIPEGRQHATGGVVGSTFYVIGGRWFSQTAVRGTVFELDLANTTKGWKTSPAYMPTPRGGLCGSSIKQTFYTFGGEGDPNTASGVWPQSESYNTATQKWSDLVRMQVPRHGTFAAAVGGRVYIPGGGLQQDGKPVTQPNGTVTFDNASAHFDAYCI